MNASEDHRMNAMTIQKNDSSFALGSFSHGEQKPFLGMLRKDRVFPVSAVGRGLPGGNAPTLFALLQDWERSFALLRSAVPPDGSGGEGWDVASLEVHAPLPEARQVFCTGANYRKHVVEMVEILGVPPETDGMSAEARRAFGEAYVKRQLAESEPYVFMKPPSSIAGPYDDLVLPDFSDKSDWEIELGAVIGHVPRKTTRETALSCVAGYMVVNDLTARDKVRRTDPGAIGPDWLGAKGAAGFLPTGPYFVPREYVGDPQSLVLTLKLNGEVMQSESTSDMTFDVARQIEFISRHVRMLPGDILCTGSPAGNGIARGRFLRPGDVMEAEISGLGRQVVRCVKTTDVKNS